MSGVREFYEQPHGRLADAHAAAAVGAGMLLVNVLAPEAATVYTNDPAWKKAALALPSAFPADEVSGNQVFDVAFQTAYSVASIELARRTTSREGVAYTAFGAQALACAGNGLIEGSGLMKSEKPLKDVGFSAIFSALANKYLLDKRLEAKSKGETAKSLMYLGTLAVLDTGLTAGAYLVENGGGAGLLAASSHAAGIAVGAVAHGFGEFRNKAKRTHLETRLAAHFNL